MSAALPLKHGDGLSDGMKIAACVLHGAAWHQECKGTLHFQ